MIGPICRIAEKQFGLRVTRVGVTRIAAERNRRLADLPQEIRRTVDQAQPYTLTTPERLASLCLAVEHVVKANVPGAFVECGVWKGGSTMAAAWSFRRLNRQDVDLYLFDTFEGMSEPGEEDVYAESGVKAKQWMDGSERAEDNVWVYAPIDLVRRNLAFTQYPTERLHFIKGKVEDTLPDSAPEQIAILRLDTDWYASTKHELLHLYPRLSKGGILIIDDYGDWQGARKAVDEYFAEQDSKPFLMRIDAARILVKP